LEQVLFFYYLNYQKCVSKYWHFAKITRYKEFAVNNYTPQKIRGARGKIIKKGGWHFSYLGGVEAIKNKIRSFAHQEYNNEKYVNDEIANKIHLGLDIANRKGFRFVPIKITEKTHPKYIVNNESKYEHFIYPNINQYIVIKNTIYCSVILLCKLVKIKIIQLVKIILPENAVSKLKRIQKTINRK
jgi:beta-1,4-mannosyl-glycoprotein beta-1,4-N-acetylglucosaminyltransferase